MAWMIIEESSKNIPCFKIWIKLFFHIGLMVNPTSTSDVNCLLHRMQPKLPPGKRIWAGFRESQIANSSKTHSSRRLHSSQEKRATPDSVVASSDLGGGNPPPFMTIFRLQSSVYEEPRTVVLTSTLQTGFLIAELVVHLHFPSKHHPSLYRGSWRYGLRKKLKSIRSISSRRLWTDLPGYAGQPVPSWMTV